MEPRTPDQQRLADPSPPAEPGSRIADRGSEHLARIGRIQMALLPLGTGGWALHGWRSALVFGSAGAASVGFWQLHQLLVARMLTPSIRRRWVYGFLVLLKLALIVVLLRGMMIFFPLEVLPLVTGILLFSASILMEAFWLILRPIAQDND